ncbi:MAG: LacI family DNA-binding transcriptional regulator [Gaiellaceae bacterium]
MTTTLREIALRTGVSVSTVSRVLNGHSGVSAEVRERVLALADELDYTPNAAARTLVLQHSRLLTVVIRTGDHREFQHPFYQVILDGIKRKATEFGYDLLILSHEGIEYGDDSTFFVTRARRHQVEGAILMGVREPDLESFVKFKIPAVTIDFEPQTKIEGLFGVVRSDNVAGAEMAVTHLHSLGHRRIAHIAGLLNTSAGIGRLVGYRNALEQLGLPYRDEYVVEADYRYGTGCEAMRKFLALPEPPDAVFAASDMSALGAMRAIRELGQRVPDDVAIVGYDDILFASLSIPTLTTVRQDKDELGESACGALIELVEGRASSLPQLILPVELIVRESCGGVAGGEDTFGIGLDAVLARESD